MGVDLIDNSFNPLGQPIVTSQDFDFIQYGIRDSDAAIVESLLGSSYDASKSYILKGCVQSTLAGTTSISAGYIFGISKALGSMLARTYIYSVAAQSFPDPTGMDVILCTVTAFPQSYDPVTFADSSTHSIHNEWRIVFSVGVSGSADLDFDDLVNFVPDWVNISTYSGTYTADVVNPIAIMKENLNGVIRMRGISANSAPGLVSTNQQICTLPAGYWPSAERWVVAACPSGIGAQAIMLDIATDGKVYAYGVLTAFDNTALRLDISFAL